MNFTDSRLIFFLILVQYVHSIDYESAKEKTCIKITKTAKPDLSWMMSVKKWHYPLMSRFDLYSTMIDLTKKSPKDISEDEIYYKSCVHWTANAGNEIAYTVFGFGNRKAVYKIKPLDQHFASMEVYDEDGRAGTAHTTLTDNKSFIFNVLCVKDLNQMGWGVASPYKTLPKETIKKIHDHAESLGFKREHFTALRYESSCNKDEDTKDEL